MKLLLELFLIFAKMGAVTFGGGYAMLPILQREIVENKHWGSEEELMERISESAKATVDYFKDHISFINVMRNMSVSCDCEGVSAAPVVTPNVGILASLDICAIDQASVDLIYAMKEEDHHDLVERIKTRHGLRQLSYMQELGMGNRKYKLIDLDNNQSPLTLQEAVAHVVPFVEPKKVTL